MFFDFLSQKCLDKDPAKRWSCERLLHHPVFDDYLAMRAESSIDQPDANSQFKNKSKVSECFELKKCKIRKINDKLFIFSHRTHRYRCLLVIRKSMPI